MISDVEKSSKDEVAFFLKGREKLSKETGYREAMEPALGRKTETQRNEHKERQINGAGAAERKEATLISTEIAIIFYYK